MIHTHLFNRMVTVKRLMELTMYIGKEGETKERQDNKMCMKEI
jgi:hypothetical protein